MKELVIHLFDIDESKIMSLLKRNGIVLGSNDFRCMRNGLETIITINDPEQKYNISDILNPLKQYLISTEDKDIFNVLANYFDVFNKTIILLDHGSQGIFTTELLQNLENKSLLKKSLILNDINEYQKIFDLSPLDTSAIAFVSEQNVYKIIKKELTKNVCDYTIVALTVFKEPSSAEEKVFQAFGKTIIGINDINGLEIKVYKYNGDTKHVSLCTAQMIAWLLLQKFKFGL